MTRFLSVAAALTLLAPAGAAADLSTGPAASAKRDFSVAFDIRYRATQPRVVRKFKFKRVVITCDSGPSPNPFTTKSIRPHFGPMSINRHGRFGRAFANTGPEFKGRVVIRGEFLTRRRLEGTLKIRGDYPEEGYAGCSSGEPLRWEERVG